MPEYIYWLFELSKRKQGQWKRSWFRRRIRNAIFWHCVGISWSIRIGRLNQNVICLTCIAIVCVSYAMTTVWNKVIVRFPHFSLSSFMTLIITQPSCLWHWLPVVLNEEKYELLKHVFVKICFAFNFIITLYKRINLENKVFNLS